MFLTIHKAFKVLQRERINRNQKPTFNLLSLHYSQMKPSLLATLLVLSSILYEAQGIHLGKVASSTGHQEIQEEDSALMKRSEEANIDCKDGNCKGRNRKLLTKNVSTSTTTSTTPTSKVHVQNHKKEENKAASKLEGKSSCKEEILTVNSSRVSDHGKAAPEGYPDILDIAGMDYTPAKRKPPIHN